MVTCIINIILEISFTCNKKIKLVRKLTLSKWKNGLKANKNGIKLWMFETLRFVICKQSDKERKLITCSFWREKTTLRRRDIRRDEETHARRDGEA